MENKFEFSFPDLATIKMALLMKWSQIEVSL